MRFLALGDSYTIGEGVPPTAGWPAQLAERLRAAGVSLADPVIVARTGWTTTELDAGIAEAAPRGPFALVSLLIGVNDQYRQWDLATYQAGFTELLRQAIDYAGGIAAQVLVLSIPDWGVTPFAQKEQRDASQIAVEIDAFNDINRREAARQGAVYVDVTEISRQAAAKPVWIAADGLHPSAAMYAAWVDVLAPVVGEILRGM